MTSVMTATTTTDGTAGGLVLAREQIMAARGRGMTPSDGGSSGRSDNND